MLTSIEDQEPYSRVSKYQTGQLPKADMDGNLIPTLDKLGKMLLMIWMLNQLQFHSQEKDLNQILFNGSDSNSLEKVPLQDFSITKCQTQHGLDMEVILKTQRRNSIHSRMPIKIKKSFSEWTQQPKKEENNSERSGNPCVNLYQNF